MIDDETLSCPPEGGAMKKAFLGYLVPGLIVVYAISFDLIAGHLVLPLKHSAIEFTGYAARWLGFAYLSLASFMHFHFGWGLSETLWPHSQKGKWSSLLIFLPSLFIAICLHSKLL